MERVTGIGSDVIIKSFGAPDETRILEKGKFELVKIGSMTIGRASYEPGWKWSEHVGSVAGTARCEIEHVGLIISGRAPVVMNDGTEIELRPGDVFFIGPGHDSWVVGDELSESLHFLGADEYARS